MDEINVVTSPEQVAALIDPTAMDPTFAQTLAEIEASKKKKEEDAAKLAELAEKTKPKPKPLQLKYIYEGTHSCNNPVKTIVTTAQGVTTATAYCLTCDETVSQIEVQPINNPKIEPEKPQEVVKTAPTAPSGIIPKKENK